MRKALLGLALAVVLAGCIGGGGPGGTVTLTSSDAPTTHTPGEPGSRTDGPADPATTDGPDDEQTTATTPCEEHRVQTVDPVRESVTPSPLPERPANLTAESVREYVEAYEKAYRRNIGLEKNTRTYEVSITDVSVNRESERFNVTVEAMYWYNAGGPKPGTETATVIHADGPYYTVVYTVTEGRMLRDSELVDGNAKLGDGNVLECWA